MVQEAAKRILPLDPVCDLPTGLSLLNNFKQFIADNEKLKAHLEEPNNGDDQEIYLEGNNNSKLKK